MDIKAPNQIPAFLVEGMTVYIARRGYWRPVEVVVAHGDAGNVFSAKHEIYNELVLREDMRVFANPINEVSNGQTEPK